MKNEEIESRVDSLMDSCFDQLLIKTVDVKWAIFNCVTDGKISDKKLLESIDCLIGDYIIVDFNRAMEYLSENDPSLQESIYIAKEYGGYTMLNLNSPALATLHIRAKVRKMNIEGCSKFCSTFNK